MKKLLSFFLIIMITVSALSVAYAKEDDEGADDTEVKVERIEHPDTNELLTVGEKFKCRKIIYPENADNKKVKWKITNKKIAKINKKGVVKAKRKGICYAYAVSKENKKIKSSKRIKIIVTDYKFTKSILKNNNNYKHCRAIVPKGIVVHSTGANTPYATTYIANWNTPKPGGREVCVHGFLGKSRGGGIGFYQALPFEMACWGVGNGSKGSYNYYPGYIQFECCEDNLHNRGHFYTIYHKATDLCAYLCLKYNFSYKTVVSHAESHKKGYGSNHGDIDHWLRIYGLNMNDFRKEVKKKIYKTDPHPDLKTGKKNPKVQVLKDTVLRKKRCVDDYGNSTKTVAKLKKGDTVKFIWDRGRGWSYVKYKGKKGFIRNKFLKLKYKSYHYSKKTNSKTTIYSRPTQKSKYKIRVIGKGKKAAYISSITKGKKRGWSYIKYKGKEGYIKSKYLK